MTSKNDHSEDRLTRILNRLSQDPQYTHEESARLKAEREAAYGTMFEWAEMQQDLSIAVNVEQWLLDGTQGHGSSISAPGDEDYEFLLKSHNLLKPGDASTIVKRLVDGVWVVQDDNLLRSSQESAREANLETTDWLFLY